MSRNKVISLCAIASVLTAGLLWAQQASPQANASGSAQADAKGSAQATATESKTSANADADAYAKLDPDQRLKMIQTKASKVSAKSRHSAESKLELAAKSVDQEAEKIGEEKMAARLAAEFGTTAEAMDAEKEDLHISWGNLMIAHTLAANTKTAITASELGRMHEDGTGWGTLAAGLGLKLGETVSGVKAEGRVAQGLAKADGKAAVIHGEGARAGLGANTGVHAGVGAANGQVGAGVDSKVGLKVGH